MLLVYKKLLSTANKCNPIPPSDCALFGTTTTSGMLSITAQQLSGELMVDTLGANYSMLAGNVVALVSPRIIIIIMTLKSLNIFGIVLRIDEVAVGHGMAGDAVWITNSIEGFSRTACVSQ